MHTRQIHIHRTPTPSVPFLSKPPFQSSVDERRTFSRKQDIYVGKELVALPICAEEHAETPRLRTHDGAFPVALNYVNEKTHAAMMEDHANRYHDGKPVEKDGSVWKYRRKEF